MNIQITERDCALLHWINRCGFVTVQQVSEQLSVAVVTAYKRLQKLTAHQYLEYHRITINCGMYCACMKGVHLSESPLPPLRKIPLATYRHHLQVTTLLMRLQRHWGGQYITERELRHQHGQEHFGLKTHVSDGDFLFHDQRIAVEVELSKKIRYRRDKIFHFYLKSREYHQVRYVCGHPSVGKQMQVYEKEADWLTLHNLNSVLQHPDRIKRLHQGEAILLNKSRFQMQVIRLRKGPI